MSRLVSAFDLSLLPRSASVDDRGEVAVSGVVLSSLAAEYGTPLFVYDEAELRARCQEYRAAFTDGVAYASKAFLCTAMAQLVAEEGIGIDVATGGELFVALRGGVPAERITLHGNNKSEAELRKALEVRIGRVVADSFDELDRLERLVAEGLPEPHVQVRVTPGVAANTHAYIETGTDDSKFGFSLGNGDALAAVERVITHPQLHFAGIHCHIGSQVYAIDSFTRATQKMIELVGEIEAKCETTVDEVNVGGGLGVRYLAEDEPPSIAEYAARLREGFEEALNASGVQSRPRLTVEPGRSIAAPAGLTLYRVGTVKRIPGVRTYVAVDGGMSDNLRPVTYGARYEAFVPTRATAGRTLVATIAGKHCEQGDLVVRDATLPEDIAVDDLLAVPVTGAYGQVMANNYNKVTRPAVVFVRDGQARLVVRRETDEDLVRLDQ